MANYRVRLTQGINSYTKQANNVFFFNDGGVVAPSVGVVEIATEFQANILPAINAIQTSTIQNVTLTVEELDGPAIDISSLSGAGTWAPSTQMLPPYVAAGFRLVRTTTQTRSGAKRFVGVPEAEVTNQNIVNPGTYRNALNALAVELKTALVGASDNYEIGRASCRERV